MHHITGIKARVDLFYACFFCGRNGAAECASFCHDGKKEGSNAENNE